MDPSPGDAEELAWAAGFFDAEGSFSYTEAGRYVCVSIAQVGRQRLDRFGSAVRTGRVLGPYDPRHPSRPSKQLQYSFRANGCEHATRIALALWPHLGVVKRIQARRALDSAVVRCIKHVDHPALRIDEAPAGQIPWRQELAWAAGLLEGDGTFSYATVRGNYRNPCVAIGQNGREVLDRFRQITLVGKVYGPYERAPGGLGGRPMFQYRASGHEKVQAVAAMLWLWLGPGRRAQAASVLSILSQSCHRGHRKRPGHKGCPQCTAAYWDKYRSQHPKTPDVLRYPRQGRVSRQV